MAAPGDFSIFVDLSALMPASGPIDASVLPNLAHAVQMIADRAEAQWKAYAAGAPLPNGKSIGNNTGEYVRSITQRQVGPFAITVYSDLPYAKVIEEGSPQRDMKKILSSSPKVRVSATGRRYLIIPFRHGSPNSISVGRPMPQAVADWWKSRSASSVTGTYKRISGTGAYDIMTRNLLTVPGFRYKWGDRLKSSDLGKMGIGGKESKRLDGMVNFRQSGKSGGAAHSGYITFRVMAEGAPGWIAPAREGMWPARTTAEMFRPVAEEAFREAVAIDIAAMLGQAP